MATLLYQGHGSLRITTDEGTVIYVDPYAGSGYDRAADLILITHDHHDHTAVERIARRNEGCRVISYKEALHGGVYETFSLDNVTVEAVAAGNNSNHDIHRCVGFLLTLRSGVTVYCSGDTSATAQMKELACRHIDYAFFCCDGIYNMDAEEAARCAGLVAARHSIPYHMAPGKLFDLQRAQQFRADGAMIVPAGEEITLTP